MQSFLRFVAAEVLLHVLWLPPGGVGRAGEQFLGFVAGRGGAGERGVCVGGGYDGFHDGQAVEGEALVFLADGVAQDGDEVGFELGQSFVREQAEEGGETAFEELVDGFDGSR